MPNIYELLAQRQTALEEREKELLVVLKELEGVQQELEDIRAMSNIRLLAPAKEDEIPSPSQETQVADAIVSTPEVDVSDLLAKKAELKAQGIFK